MTKRKAKGCEFCAIQDQIMKSLKVGEFMTEIIDGKATYLIVRLEDRNGKKSNSKGICRKERL